MINSEFLSFCLDNFPGLDDTLQKLEKACNDYNCNYIIAGGAPTIYFLNKLTNKNIPLSHLEDIDIFVYGTDRLFVKKVFTGFIPDEVSSYGTPSCSDFESYRHLTDNHNIIYSHLSTPEEIIDNFDFNCNQIYADTDGYFGYSNNFIRFLDSGVIQPAKVNKRSLSRYFFKLFQYEALEENERNIKSMLRLFASYQSFYHCTLSKKVNKDLVKKTRMYMNGYFEPLYLHEAGTFTDITFNISEYQDVTQSSPHPYNASSPPLYSSCLFYRTLDVIF